MNSRTFVVAASAVLALLISAPLAADSSLPDETVAALERFYHHFGGDGWHNQDGWLEPGSDPCQWHGVGCYGDQEIYRLALPANNLVGAWHESDIADFVIGQLHLRGNRIGGQLSALPTWLSRIDLSDNDLRSELPEISDHLAIELRILELSNNDLEGAVPDSWALLDLFVLHLDGNRLEGPLEPALMAMNAQPQGHLNLADNLYSGPLPESLMSLQVDEHGAIASGGGINLCWNNIEIPSEELDEWLQLHHVGGPDYQRCLNRERVPIGSEVSGSWFDPERSGEGLTLQLLDSGHPLLYMFTFDTFGRPHWLFEVGNNLGMAFHWHQTLSTRGRFGEGMTEFFLPHQFGLAAGAGFNWRLDRVGESEFHFERTYAQLCESLFPCVWSIFSDRLDYIQLSRLAGSTCDNRQPHDWISGAWFDPDRYGEGFVVEVIEDGRGVVYWFTYEPGDSEHQAWMTGDAMFDGNTLTIDNLLQPRGGQWGDGFDPAEIELVHWGSLTMEFTDNNAGHIAFDSVFEDYGAGAHPIVRLTRPQLADCD